MPRGGARPGAGRPKGSKGWKAKIDFARLTAITPLDFMLAVLNTKEAPVPIRFAAAKAAAPYCHRKLAAEAAPLGEKEGAPTGDDADWDNDMAGSLPN